MTKILFIQVGSGFKYPNRHLLVQLNKHFPGSEIIVYDLLDDIRGNYWCLFVNLLYMIKENLGDQLTGKKNLFRYRLHFLGTTFIFKKLSSLIQKKVEQGSYDFIFQTQSLCNSWNAKGVPFYIYTDHTNLNNLNYNLIPNSQFLRSKKYVTLETKAYENARLIFVMSDNIKNSLISQYNINSEKIKLIYVSTNTAINQIDNKEKYKNKNILFVGKDWTRKGGPLLVEAFKLVQQNVPSATLTIIGCKPQLEIPNCVVYGELSLEKVGEIYNQATLFCMPTLREPFGIVFLEAMFNRLPIVTNEVGATPYLVKDGHNGYLVKYEAQEYATVLTRLLNDPKTCEQFGANSYEIVSKTYTWDHVGDLIERYVLESK